MKDAYYFSHDAHARHDPKIVAMINDYGVEGYGRFWIIVEMLREEADHRLQISSVYMRNALAVQMHCDADAAHKFVQDCIEKFELFETDGDYFWSNSLLRRMDLRKARSEQARQAAVARWEKKKKVKNNADAMREQCDRNAIKEKERKEKEKESTKEILSPSPKASVPSTATPYDDIVQAYHACCPSLPKIKKLTEKRKRIIRTRWRADPDIEVFRALFKKAEASDFLTGRNGKWTSCNFDWLMNESNAVKVLEGNYDNKGGGSNEKAREDPGRDMAGKFREFVT